MAAKEVIIFFIIDLLTSCFTLRSWSPCLFCDKYSVYYPLLRFKWI